MKKRIDQTPRFLDDVIDAIRVLREVGGSRSTSIVNYVKKNIGTKGYPVTRNITLQIRKALKHAMNRGIIRQRAGKFRIDIARRKKRPDPCTDCGRCKKGKKKRRKKRSCKTKKKKVSYKTSAGYYTDTDISECSSSDLPVKKVKRGRKNRGRRKKYGKRGSVRKKPSVQIVDDDNESGKEIDNSADEDKTEVGYRDDRNSDDDDEEQPNNICSCDNPDCLCNVKQEDDDEEMNEYNKPL